MRMLDKAHAHLAEAGAAAAQDVVAVPARVAAGDADGNHAQTQPGEHAQHAGRVAEPVGAVAAHQQTYAAVGLEVGFGADQAHLVRIRLDIAEKAIEQGQHHLGRVFKGRRKVKRLGVGGEELRFGLLFGITANGLAARLGCRLAEGLLREGVVGGPLVDVVA